MVRRASAEREREGLHAGIEKLDLEEAIADGALLAHELIPALRDVQGLRIVSAPPAYANRNRRIGNLHGAGECRLGYLSSKTAEPYRPDALQASALN
jgi:hypothetical protein